MKIRKPALAFTMLLPLTAWSAGGHYPVDDADIVEPGVFQIETWYTHFDSRNAEFGFLPAMTFFDQLEVTAGFLRLEAGGENFNRFEPAAKWQFAPLEDGAVASAVSSNTSMSRWDAAWAAMPTGSSPPGWP